VTDDDDDDDENEKQKRPFYESATCARAHDGRLTIMSVLDFVKPQSQFPLYPAKPIERFVIEPNLIQSSD